MQKVRHQRNRTIQRIPKVEVYHVYINEQLEDEFQWTLEVRICQNSIMRNVKLESLIGTLAFMLIL